MLTAAYIAALLVSEHLADLVWDAWSSGEIENFAAYLTSWIMANIGTDTIATANIEAHSTARLQN